MRGQAARKWAEIRKLVPGLPEAVAAVIDRATAVKPEERYQTMEELRVALDGGLGEAEKEAPRQRGGT